MPNQAGHPWRFYEYCLTLRCNVPDENSPYSMPVLFAEIDMQLMKSPGMTAVQLSRSLGRPVESVNHTLREMMDNSAVRRDLKHVAPRARPCPHCLGTGEVKSLPTGRAPYAYYAIDPMGDDLSDEIVANDELGKWRNGERVK